MYPTYSHYFESLQASGKKKAMTFDVLVEKITERENLWEEGISFQFQCRDFVSCIERSLEESLLIMIIVA
jgi:hypothetical protein